MTEGVRMRRLPSQFDLGLSARTAATPTCSSCSCCCCCLATIASTPVINSVVAGELAKRNNRPAAPAYLLGAVTPLVGLFIVVPLVVYATLQAGGLFGSGATNFGGASAVLVALFAGGLTLGYYYLMTKVTARVSGAPNRVIPWTIALWLLPGLFSIAECAVALVLIFKVSYWAYLLLVVLVVPGSYFAMNAIIKARQDQASMHEPSADPE